MVWQAEHVLTQPLIPNQYSHGIHVNRQELHTHLEGRAASLMITSSKGMTDHFLIYVKQQSDFPAHIPLAGLFLQQ